MANTILSILYNLLLTRKSLIMVNFKLNRVYTLVSTLLIASTLFVSSVHAQNNEIKESCSNVVALFNDGDIDGALEEARWCVTQLEQLKQGQTSSYFKDEIDGYKGGKLDVQQAMGMSMIERRYTKGNDSVQVSLSGGVSNIAASALEAFASFGVNATPGKKIRIQRRTATLNNQSDSPQLLVTLKSGGILTFESSQLSEDALVAFAKSFPIAELDDSRK
jgi:hypothetical protein